MAQGTWRGGGTLFTLSRNFKQVYSGTFYAAPARDPMLVATEQAERAVRPSYPEIVADRIIADWRASGEMKIGFLRGLIIKAFEDYD